MRAVIGQAHLSSSAPSHRAETQDSHVPDDNLESDFNKDGKDASYAKGFPLQWGEEFWKFSTHGDALAGGVTSGSATPDENFLACSTGQSICIFALDDYSLSCVLKSEFGEVKRVEFAPFPTGGKGGYVLASDVQDDLGSGDQQVQIWFLDGECKEKGDGVKVDGHLATFSSTSFSHDGKKLLYLSDAHDDFGAHAQVTALDVKTGKKEFSMQGHIRPIMSVGFSPNDKLIVSNAWDGFAKLYDVKDGKHVRDLGPTGGQNWACDFSPNSENLALSRGSGLPITFVWRPGDPQSFPIALQGTSGWQRVISWSPDGSRLAIGAEDGRLVVYDASAMGLEQVWQLGEMDERWIREVTNAKWLDNSKRLMFTPMDGSVQMYDFETNKKWKWAAGEKDEWRFGAWFNTLVVLEGRRLFGSKDQDGTYRIWKLPDV